MDWYVCAHLLEVHIKWKMICTITSTRFNEINRGLRDENERRADELRIVEWQKSHNEKSKHKMPLQR